MRDNRDEGREKREFDFGGDDSRVAEQKKREEREREAKKGKYLRKAVAAKRPLYKFGEKVLMSPGQHDGGDNVGLWGAIKKGVKKIAGNVGNVIKTVSGITKDIPGMGIVSKVAGKVGSVLQKADGSANDKSSLGGWLGSLVGKAKKKVGQLLGGVDTGARHMVYNEATGQYEPSGVSVWGKIKGPVLIGGGLIAAYFLLKKKGGRKW